MKGSIVYASLIVLSLFSETTVLAQDILARDSDYRIEKFKNAIIQYCVGKKDSNRPMIDVTKQLEFFSGTVNTKFLLIRFGIAGDDVPHYWGILGDEEKYFFYDADDLGEPDLIAFKKKYDPGIIAMVLFYCNQFPREEIGFIPKGTGVYLQNLATIKEALHQTGCAHIVKVDSAMAFFEKTTSIKSESNYPTRKDYTDWLNWLKKNHSKL